MSRVQKMGDLKKNQLVVKSNKLIEASYRLTLQEQRVILLLASLIEIGDKDFKRYQLSIHDFKKMVGLASTGGYTEIKEITEKLLGRVMVIKDVINKRELQISWLSSAEYFDGQGFVELEFSPKLKPYLLELKERFTSYSLQHVISLKSSYSIRIYELLKQYEKIGERYFELIELKIILGLKNDEYKLYGHFKNKILSRAKYEISDNTDLKFDFFEKKQGKKVAGVFFFIKHNNKNDNSLPIEAKSLDIDIDIYLLLQQNFCLSPVQAQAVLKQCPNKSELTKILAHVERRYKAGELKDLAAYTVYAAERKIQDQLSLFDTEALQKKETAAQEKAKKERLEELRNQFNQEISQKARNEFDQLPENQQLKMIQDCEDSLDSFEKEQYVKRGKDFNKGTFLKLKFNQHLVSAFLSEEERNFDLWVKTHKGTF